MVRNIMSMQNLRNNMAEMKLSPSAQRSDTASDPQATQDPPQRLQPFEYRPSVQICGNDANTKALMNRVATGQATDAERAEFDQYVQGVGGSKATSSPPQSYHNHNHTHAPTPSTLAPKENHALQNYRMGLMLLEQQKKKRAILAEQDKGKLGQKSNTQVAEQSEMSIPQLQENLRYQCHAMHQEEVKERHLQQQQADLLKQQSTAKHFMAQAKTAEAYYAALAFKDQIGQQAAQGNTRQSNLDYQIQVSLLENQNKARLLMARQAQEAEAENTALKEEALRFPKASKGSAEVYCKPFCDFLTENPTVFHAVASTKKQLKDAGWTELSERDEWEIETSGKYFVERNGSSLIAFVVGANYEPGNGAAILAGHVDALTTKLKPISEVPNKAGYLQLGVAPYAGAMNETWWDRDLGIGGRVLVKEGDKIVTKLVNLNRPIARIPTLAPHFGAAAQGPFNKETQMTPIIGLEDDDSLSADPFSQPPILSGGASSFVSKQPPALVRAIASELGLKEQSFGDIVNWELELFDIQPATVGGLNKEFIYAGRIDDKLCSWAAMQALTGSSLYDTRFSSLIKVVAWFDNEEIGSQLRQGARSNFLPQVLERAVGSLSEHDPSSDLIGRTYANSFIVSSDVTHAVNPNFLNAYLDGHSPRLNTGLVVAADPNGHMTTDAVSTAILQRCADRIGAKLQVFQIRNDSRSGGTVGPMLSSMTGIRAIDAGMPQLSMHSIRATTGSLDPGLGVLMFTGFLNGFEHVDKEFRD